MKIVFMGTPSFAVPILEGLIEHHDVIGVVCQPDKFVGRKKTLEYPPTKVIALSHNIPVFQPKKLKDDYQAILDLNPDLIVTAAYGQFVPEVLLNAPKYKAINVHGSLLPKYRGGAPIHRALIDGCEETGVTIMYMVKKMDAGDIIFQARTTILPTDNVQTLHERLSLLGRDALLQTLHQIDHIQAVKQDESLVTFAYTIQRKDEQINFHQEANQVANFIRGMYPWPIAYTSLNGVAYKIHQGHVIKDASNYPPGTVINLDKCLVIKTRKDAISIDVIQPVGKKEMPIKDFLNGQKHIQMWDTFDRKEE